MKKIALVLFLFLSGAEAAAQYRGDIALGDTIDFKFTTVSATGAPTTIAGTSPGVSCYPDNSTTEITAGITLSIDFDSRTGMHNVRVVASSGNGYATGTNYECAITGTSPTVDSVSVLGYVVGSFSIEKRSGIRPTTAGRTLDVSATGEAGLDWANIGSPTTSQTLSGTTIGTLTSVASGGITATSIATDAIGADEIAADAIGASEVATDAIGSAEFAQAAADKAWSTAARALTDKAGFSLAATGTDAVYPSGTVVDDALNSNTTFETDLADTEDNKWKDSLLLFTGASCNVEGEVAKITAYDGTTKFVTISPAKTAEPTATDCGFLILNR
jgi:hypothetical protein